MSDIAIHVENLSKLYRIGAKQEPYRTLRDTLASAASAPFRRIHSVFQPKRDQPTTQNDFWALKDVSFEVKRGEVVGIIGRNGAGKSTLLKILSRITEPTSGYADIHGRVGSLLEVGTGFHPELTGRENIYLNGAILGMKRAEIDRKLDEIVAFAEVEQFVDTAVKHYSSGMYLRLAFAVAAHLEPEILIIDEVLAVGDIQFQKKCLGKMGEVAKQGRTVLFVSHNMTAARSLCTRVVWLERGNAVQDDTADKVIANYVQQTVVNKVAEQTWNNQHCAPGNNEVRLRHVSVRTTADEDEITVATPLELSFEYWNLIPNAYLNLSISVFNMNDVCVFTTTTALESEWHGRPFPTGLFRSICRIPGFFFNNGLYRVVLLLVKDAAFVVYRYEDVLVFEVGDISSDRGGWYGEWAGIVRPRLDWSTELTGDI